MSEQTSDPDIRLITELVAAQSYSGAERPAADVFVRHGADLGFETEIDEVGNAIAHIGASEPDALVHLVCLGHIDTVAGEIEVRINDGVLHGRGSVDAKGPLAAMLVGVSRASIPAGVRVTVVGAVGEEAAGSIGARHLVDRWRPDACIIGEPSGVEGITLGYKGRLLVHAIATCPNTHSAGRDPSASDRILAWWSRVVSMVETFNEGPDRAFDQIQVSIEKLSSANDGLEQIATLAGGFRIPPAIGPDELMVRVRDLADDHLSLQFEGSERAHATTRNDPVVRALSSAIRAHGYTPRPKLKTGTADLNVVAPIWECPIAAYGPGDSALDHTPIEHLHLEEYTSSIRIMSSAIGILAAELLAAKRTQIESV